MIKRPALKILIVILALFGAEGSQAQDPSPALPCFVNLTLPGELPLGAPRFVPLGEMQAFLKVRLWLSPRLEDASETLVKEFFKIPKSRMHETIADQEAKAIVLHMVESEAAATDMTYSQLTEEVYKYFQSMEQNSTGTKGGLTFTQDTQTDLIVRVPFIKDVYRANLSDALVGFMNQIYRSMNTELVNAQLLSIPSTFEETQRAFDATITDDLDCKMCDLARLSIDRTKSSFSLSSGAAFKNKERMPLFLDLKTRPQVQKTFLLSECSAPSIISEPAEIHYLALLVIGMASALFSLQVLVIRKSNSSS